MITAGRRETDVVRLLALHRFLTRPQLEEFLFAESTLTPRSRQVVTWRLLGRLQRHGLVAATPRQTGGAVAGSTLPGYFLTTSGLRLAATFYPDLPARRPARRAPFLFAHSSPEGIRTPDLFLERDGVERSGLANFSRTD